MFITRDVSTEERGAERTYSPRRVELPLLVVHSSHAQQGMLIQCPECQSTMSEEGMRHIKLIGNLRVVRHSESLIEETSHAVRRSVRFARLGSRD